MRRHGWPVAVALLTLSACDEGPCRTLPREPDLESAAQLLPDNRRAQLTREQVVHACQAWTACSDRANLQGYTLEDCIRVMLVSAEDGGLVLRSNESARFLIECISSAAGDCEGVLACSTPNPLYDLCGRVGCPRGQALVTCNGSVATVSTADGPVTRDCARSDRACNPERVSGCDDALSYACPRQRIGERVDECYLTGGWCEGNVQVSCVAGDAIAVDCGVFGGACEETSSDEAACVYPDVPEAGCESPYSLEQGTDSKGEFQCVRGLKVYLEQ